MNKFITIKLCYDVNTFFKNHLSLTKSILLNIEGLIRKVFISYHAYK